MSEPVTTKAPGRRRMYLLVRMLCEGGVMIALALVLGLPFVLRDRGISSRARIFFAVLALAEVLFPVVLAGEKLL